MRSLERRLTVLESRKRQRKARPNIFIAAYDRMDADVIGFASPRGQRIVRDAGETLGALKRRAVIELPSRILTALYRNVPIEAVASPLAPQLIAKAHPVGLAGLGRAITAEELRLFGLS